MPKPVARILPLLLVAATGFAHANLTETTIVTNRVNVPPSSATTWTDVTVRCPVGLVALSGGVDTASFTVIEIASLAPTFGGNALAFQANGVRSAADGWYASVKNFDTVARTVAVVAVCAPLSGVQVSIASTTVATGSANAPTTSGTSAICPLGFAAVGGGIDLALPASMRVSTLAPVYGTQFLIDIPAGQQSAPTGWNGNARNEGGSGTVKVAAICAPLAGVVSIVNAPFSVVAGTASGQSARCPAGMLVLGGGVDSNELTRNVISVATPLFPSEPQFPVDRAAGSWTGANGWYNILYSHSTANGTAKVAAVCAPPTAGVAVVYEFYNTAIRHYFRTSSAGEAAGVDRGTAGAGWVRTGDNFFAYAAGANAPGSDVCRFYTFGANSHFYTAFADECAGLRSPNSGWVYEGLSFRIQLPTAAGCASNMIPVYRLYNNRFQFTDSNHRFTTRFADVAPLQQQGWTYEGVAFCAPNF